MKKLIFIGLFLMASIINAQVSKLLGIVPYDNNKKSTGVVLLYADTTTSPWQFHLVHDTSGVTKTALQSSTNHYSRWLITDSAIDTIVFGFTPRIITVVFDEPISDTLFVAGDTNGIFADSLSMITRLGTEGFTKRWATDTLFVKVGVNITEFQHVRIEAY